MALIRRPHNNNNTRRNVISTRLGIKRLYPGIVVGVITLVIVFFLWITNRNNQNYYWEPSSLLRISEAITASSPQQISALSSILQPLPKDTTTIQDYPPLSCPTFLQHVQQNHSSPTIHDPNQGHNMYSRYTQFWPHFYISLHHKGFDGPRWSVYERGYYYETALSEAFSMVLNTTSNTQTKRVLDVGGNIGYFTLLAAAHGNVVVDSFEPNLKNSLRVCESLQLNHWSNEYETPMTANNSHVNWHPYGVGSQEGTLWFQEEKNPGQGQLLSNNNGADNNNNDSPNSHPVRVITLDGFARERGWLSSSKNPATAIAILKVDVEGYEEQVMQGAQQLLQQHVIQNIFMEVSARNKQEIASSRTTLEIIASAGYNVYQYGGFRGPKHVVNWSCSNVTQLMELVIHEVTKKKHPQLNLWWKVATNTDTDTGIS